MSAHNVIAILALGSVVALFLWVAVMSAVAIVEAPGYEARPQSDAETFAWVCDLAHDDSDAEWDAYLAPTAERVSSTALFDQTCERFFAAQLATTDNVADLGWSK